MGNLSFRVSARPAVLAAALVPLLALSACGSPSASAGGAAPTGSASASATATATATASAAAATASPTVQPAGGGEAEAPNQGATMQAKGIPASILQADGALLDSVSQNRESLNDAQIEDVANRTISSWPDKKYDSPSVTTAELKTAALRELKSLGVDAMPGAIVYDPDQKDVVVFGGDYLFWISVKPQAVEDVAARDSLGHPDAPNQKLGQSVSSQCRVNVMIRIGRGNWVGLSANQPAKVNLRKVGTTPVKTVQSCAG